MQISYSAGQGEGRKVLNFFNQVEERVKALPGIESVALSDGVPMLGSSETTFAIEGRPPAEPGKRPITVLFVTSPDYLKAMGIKLLRGRFFTEQDTQSSPLVAVIDEDFARQHFPNEDPIGKFLEGNKELNIPHFEIVGIVSHVRNYGLDTPGPVQAELYYAFKQVPDKFLPQLAGRMSVVARTTTDQTALTAAVRHEVQAVDPNQPVFNVNTMQQVLADSLASQRLSMLLLSIFAGVAMILAAVGIYGVLSYTVIQRTHEIGIRMALGARVPDVIRLVLGHAMMLVTIGIGLGLVGAFAVTRVMASLLYGVSATDPLTFGGVSLLLAAIALVACLIPARRATKVDPMVALRHE
jgi:putative ABC transport system permease protein